MRREMFAFLRTGHQCTPVHSDSKVKRRVRV